MKEYISRVSDDQIMDWVIEYLHTTGWCNPSVGSLQDVDDIIVARGKDSALITIYYAHPLKDSDYDEYVTGYDDNGTYTQKVCQSFVASSFDFECFDITEDQIQKTIYGGEDINEDARKFWCNKMFQKFKTLDEEYGHDLYQHNQQQTRNKTKAQEEQVENQMEIFADSYEIGL